MGLLRGGGGGGGGGGGATAPQPVIINTALKFASNGDTNGLLHYFGTKKGTAAFANPATSGGPILAAESSINPGTTQGAVNLSDRGAASAVTDNLPDQWWRWILPENHAIKIDYYTLKTREDADNHHPRGWILEGSDDGATWTTIDSRTAQTTITGLGVFFGYTAATATAYRRVRIRQTEANSSAGNFFCASDFEFYGTLVETRPPVATSRMSFQTMFENINRIGNGLSGTLAAVNVTTGGLRMNKGDTATGGALARALDWVQMPVFDRNPSLMFEGYGSKAADSSYDWYTVVNSVGDATTLAPTRKHFGFITRVSAGVQSLLGTCANGTTQSTVALPVPAGDLTNDTLFLAKMTSGSKIEFFVNGKKYGELTTNLPAGQLTNQKWSTVIKASAGLNQDTAAVNSLVVEYDAGA